MNIAGLLLVLVGILLLFRYGIPYRGATGVANGNVVRPRLDVRSRVAALIAQTRNGEVRRLYAQNGFDRRNPSKAFRAILRVAAIRASSRPESRPAINALTAFPFESPRRP